MHQSGIIAFCFLFIAVSIWLLAVQRQQSLLNQRRAEVHQRLSTVQERWRAWALLGLTDALKKETDAFIKDNQLRRLILTSALAPNFQDTQQLWFPENKSALISRQDRYVVAELASPPVHFWSHLSDFSSVFALTAAVLVMVVGYSSYFFRKNIGQPIDNLLSSFEKLKPGEKMDLSKVSAQGELAILKREIERIHQVSTEYEKAAAVTSVATQLSHDIRSPLSALNFLAGNLPEINSEKRRIMLGAIERINGLANELLDRKKRTGGSSNSESNFCDAVQTINSLVAEKRLEIARCSNVVLRVDRLTPAKAFAEIKESELARTVSNILNNAIESIEDTGVVSIGIRDSIGGINIIIQDNGIGMTPELVSKIGQESFSVGKVNRQFKVGGSGLGMLQAKSAIERTGGKFLVQSKVGVGTSITITVPRASV